MKNDIKVINDKLEEVELKLAQIEEVKQSLTEIRSLLQTLNENNDKYDYKENDDDFEVNDEICKKVAHLWDEGDGNPIDFSKLDGNLAMFFESNNIVYYRDLEKHKVKLKAFIDSYPFPKVSIENFYKLIGEELESKSDKCIKIALSSRQQQLLQQHSYGYENVEEFINIMFASFEYNMEYALARLSEAVKYDEVRDLTLNIKLDDMSLKVLKNINATTGIAISDIILAILA